MVKSKAILFGINYNTSHKDARLRGCINDVRNMANFLEHTAKYDSVKLYTDEENDYPVSAHRIIYKLYKLAIDTHRNNIRKVWIHFSGHGCSIPDNSNDEIDGKDECILPSDYKKSGVITDDVLKSVFKYFHKDTKVVCVFDCCHSGTIGDLCYRYVNNNCHVENHVSRCMADIIILSGCADDQTSADAYNVCNRHQFTGAMTSCLIECLEENNNFENKDVFYIIDMVHDNLIRKRFTQIPQITSSKILKYNTFLF